MTELFKFPRTGGQVEIVHDLYSGWCRFTNSEMEKLKTEVKRLIAYAEKAHDSGDEVPPWLVISVLEKGLGK